MTRRFHHRQPPRPAKELLAEFWRLEKAAEEMGEGRIVSTDERDFHAYRWKNQRPFRNLLLEQA